MPEMNGVQLLGRIRREGNPLPYILITGNYSDSLERRARGAGASDVLRKSGIGMKFYTDLILSVTRAVEKCRGGGAPGTVECCSGVRV
jgi:CheY-like chemotaxis protein